MYVELIKKSFPWNKQDPTLFEGDIMFFGDKNAILNNSYRWPNAKIPYIIENVFSKSVFVTTILSDLVGRRLIKTTFFPFKAPNERNVIAFSMNEYHKYTCIQFVPRTSEGNYVRILKGGTGYETFSYRENSILFLKSNFIL